MVLCDTHALLYDALAPAELGRDAAKAIRGAHESGELACADISLWEIAALQRAGRVEADASAVNLMLTILTARKLHVLPITPTIAALAASAELDLPDPADRLIAATAIVHRATLVTKDERLRGIPRLHTLW